MLFRACLIAIDITTNQKVGGFCGEPGTEMPRISVGEPSVCKAQPQHTPNPFRRTKNTRVTLVALVFLWIRIGASSLDLWNCRI